PTRARVSANARAATAGRRRTHFPSRSTAPAGRARIGSPFSPRPRASARPAALWWRRGGGRLQGAPGGARRAGARGGRWCRGGAGLALGHVEHRLDGGAAREGGPAGETLVEDGAQAVDVGGGAKPLPRPRLLGGHVGGGADDGAGLRQPAVALDGPGQPEVGH